MLLMGSRAKPRMLPLLLALPASALISIGAAGSSSTCLVATFLIDSLASGRVPSDHMPRVRLRSHSLVVFLPLLFLCILNHGVASAEEPAKAPSANNEE
ncbi:MAG: hypothetical protein ACREQW_11515, partial [Candidatus Binatia bacterium]